MKRGRGVRLPQADRRWLAVLAGMTAIEAGWWALLWSKGLAPLPLLPAYLLLTVAGLAAAFLIRRLIRPRPVRPDWPSVLLATGLVALGASLFLPLKYAIPSEVPFWLDGPLAEFERSLFGADPWRLIDHLLGWAAVPVDRIYALWLPTQTVVLFLVLLEPPSGEKSRALIAYWLAWFLLGVAGATLLSSAGPIFYDALFGGHDFAPLAATLRERGAWVVLAESGQMRAALESGRPGLVAGISAMPSLHVAISLWIALAARSMAPRAAPFAFAYVAFIWIASVQLGWHYIADGLVGALGMLALWAVAGRIEPASDQALHAD
jgi:hypothetical protein